MQSPDDSVDPKTYKSRRLRSNLRFRSYSDAKLAGLYLDNNFPIVLFKKVFDLISDPYFKLEEISFENAWDMMDYVSARRRRIAAKRDALAHEAPAQHGDNDGEDMSAAVLPRSMPIPPVVLDLVVERLIEDDIPLGVVATEPFWEAAVAHNGLNFRNMSLVHRSWTVNAQRGLRRRVVVPYQHIDKLLYSPFCGPWITEMIIYWTVDNGHIGITKGDVWLLEALLERTPNLKSLSFNTSLAWPKDFDQPSFDVDICLEIISEVLPDLERLWLKHFGPDTPSTADNHLQSCLEMTSLCKYLPSMRSLRFLSLRAWGAIEYIDSTEQRQVRVNWDDEPPSHLKTVELQMTRDIPQDELSWILKPRGGFALRSISISIPDHSTDIESLSVVRTPMIECLPGIHCLRLFFMNAPIQDSDSSPQTADILGEFCREIMENCDKLVSLDLFLNDYKCLNMQSFAFPSNLERLAIHYDRRSLRQLLKSGERLCDAYWKDMANHIIMLPRLRSLALTTSKGPLDSELTSRDLDGIMNRMKDSKMLEPLQGGLPLIILQACKDRNVELIYLDDATPR